MPSAAGSSIRCFRLASLYAPRHPAVGEVLKHLDAPEPHSNATRLRRCAKWIARRNSCALYRNMDRPQVFNALTLLYFAAASFTETRGDSANPTWPEGRFSRRSSAFCSGVRAVRRPRVQRADPTALVKQVLTRPSNRSTSPGFPTCRDEFVWRFRERFAQRGAN